MKRLHLAEIEDQAWCPTWLRNYGTDYLQHIVNQFDVYKAVAPRILNALEKSGQNRVVDLASGGGGGWLSLSKHLFEARPDLNITLTDFYPNVDAFKRTVDRGGENFDYRTDSVDARAVPDDLQGLRTQFLSLHHFRPEEATKILQNAVDKNQPIAVFEVTERTIPSFISVLFSPIFVLLLTPFIRPFRFGRLLFTYLIPLVILLILFDGLVSVLRTYTVKEMQAMADSLEGSEGYTWEIGRQKSGPGAVLYLIGYPKTEA
ncbi:MAG: hypothetical protein AAF570_04210 [Bacteroidota bacterium]